MLETSATVTGQPWCALHDTASITTPAKPERNFAVTTAIVPVTTAIAQSKKMQIRLEIEKKRRKQGKKLEVFFFKRFFDFFKIS